MMQPVLKKILITLTIRILLYGVAFAVFIGAFAFCGGLSGSCSSAEQLMVDTVISVFEPGWALLRISSLLSNFLLTTFSPPFIGFASVTILIFSIVFGFAAWFAIIYKLVSRYYSKRIERKNIP